MELADGCLSIKIPVMIFVEQNNFMNKGHTVRFTQEYKVEVKFHSYKHQVFKRYREFRALRKSLKQNLPANDNFPKKKSFRAKTQKLLEKRKQMLENWLKTTLSENSNMPKVLEFLEIPEPWTQLTQSKTCSLSTSDKCIAQFLRRVQNENKRSRALEKFQKEFFSEKSPVSTLAVNLLLNSLGPLCGTIGVGSKALTTLNKLLRKDFYKYSEVVKGQFLALEINLLRKLSLDLHVTGEFPGTSACKAYNILQILKEHYESDPRVFEYVLCNNQEALTTFKLWEAKEVPLHPSKPKGAFSDWKKFTSNKYPGDLSLSYKSCCGNFLIKKEVEVSCSVESLVELITETELRKQWDVMTFKFEVYHSKDDCKYYQVCLLSDKKEKLEMLLKCKVTTQKGHAFIEFSEVETSDTNYIMETEEYTRVNCKSSIYEIRELGVSTRRCSSNTQDSETADLETLSEDTVCKLTCTHDISPSLAKFICGEFSEETSRFRDAFLNLKQLAEGGCASSLLGCPNSIYESLERKSLRFRRNECT